jgi:hypothetical protein
MRIYVLLLRRNAFPSRENVTAHKAVKAERAGLLRSEQSIVK